MRLSKLQQFILTSSFLNKPAGNNKKEFLNFYSDQEIKDHAKVLQDSVHNSLDNLTEKDLVIAYGHKTAKKWFIQRIRLTGAGRSLAGKIIKAKQQRLKLK